MPQVVHESVPGDAVAGMTPAPAMITERMQPMISTRMVSPAGAGAFVSFMMHSPARDMVEMVRMTSHRVGRERFSGMAVCRAVADPGIAQEPETGRPPDEIAPAAGYRATVIFCQCWDNQRPCHNRDEEGDRYDRPHFFPGRDRWIGISHKNILPPGVPGCIPELGGTGNEGREVGKNTCRIFQIPPVSRILVILQYGRTRILKGKLSRDIFQSLAPSYRVRVKE
jgi:hypothetical protein